MSACLPLQSLKARHLAQGFGGVSRRSGEHRPEGIGSAGDLSAGTAPQSEDEMQGDAARLDAVLFEGLFVAPAVVRKRIAQRRSVSSMSLPMQASMHARARARHPAVVRLPWASGANGTRVGTRESLHLLARVD